MKIKLTAATKELLLIKIETAGLAHCKVGTYKRTPAGCEIWIYNNNAQRLIC